MSQVPQDQNAYGSSGTYGSGAGGPLGMPSGFFSSLFDMNFTKYITGSVIKFLYWLVVILSTLTAAAYLLLAFAHGGVGYIVAAIVIVPIVWIVELIVYRVLLEIVMIIFRMSDDIRAIRQQGGMGAAPGGAGHQPPPGYGANPGYGVNPGNPPTDYPPTQRY
jgi:hypothetical protein